MSRARWPFVAGAINCGVVSIAALGLLIADEGAPDAVQPIAFNHSLHIENEVECLMCHAGLTDASESRLPTVDTCTTCHMDDPEPGAAAGLFTLAQYSADGNELEWDPMLRLPDHVYFSHIRHVEVAKLECVACHSDMPKRTEPPQHRRTMAMQTCVGCHEDHADQSASARRASVDCASCHR